MKRMCMVREMQGRQLLLFSPLSDWSFWGSSAIFFSIIPRTALCPGMSWDHVADLGGMICINVEELLFAGRLFCGRAVVCFCFLGLGGGVSGTSCCCNARLTSSDSHRVRDKIQPELLAVPCRVHADPDPEQNGRGGELHAGHQQDQPGGPCRWHT